MSFTFKTSLFLFMMIMASAWGGDNEVIFSQEQMSPRDFLARKLSALSVKEWMAKSHEFSKEASAELQAHPASTVSPTLSSPMSAVKNPTATTMKATSFTTGDVVSSSDPTPTSTITMKEQPVIDGPDKANFGNQSDVVNLHQQKGVVVVGGGRGEGPKGGHEQEQLEVDGPDQVNFGNQSDDVNLHRQKGVGGGRGEGRRGRHPNKHRPTRAPMEHDSWDFLEGRRAFQEHNMKMAEQQKKGGPRFLRQPRQIRIPHNLTYAGTVGSTPFGEMIRNLQPLNCEHEMKEFAKCAQSKGAPTIYHDLPKHVCVKSRAPYDDCMDKVFLKRGFLALPIPKEGVTAWEDLVGERNKEQIEEWTKN